ncbi:MAG: response regulator transcription factor [Marinilabiliales bacterium]|nr:response regulator transcription factor [Marinilabiliales bacterium]
MSKEEQSDHYASDQVFDPGLLDYSIVTQHIAFLESIKRVHGSAISIFDLSRLHHLYLSSTYQDLLGWDLEQAVLPGNDYIDGRMHPEDMEDLQRVGNQFFGLITKFKREERGSLPHFKLVMDYRTLGKEGKFVRVIEQHKVLEMDPIGNIWLSMSILDLSPDQDLTSLCRYHLVNTQTGDLHRFPRMDTAALLSLREQEILQLLAGGLISKQIADKLYISVNTVNTHRQRILEKLSVGNTTEAVQKASRLGLI